MAHQIQCCHIQYILSCKSTKKLCANGIYRRCIANRGPCYARKKYCLSCLHIVKSVTKNKSFLVLFRFSIVSLYAE
ncbi:hypothetical protein HMPREF0663_11761 [Hoylesella oralis ATCC 33269]|uniref:Uncharacterized protein n=1 Tax=Hoylesella oralis ATCC 33269 TaxID=873533 RepID=E7RRG0_9BACT|nr:hypothetical protein HMPREF0663_11761 [Hoylesella oralis ATCC 33269]